MFGVRALQTCIVFYYAKSIDMITNQFLGVFLIIKYR